MAFILLILLTALAISGTAAYFSVVGLAALFPATAVAVIIMGSVLEVGKIVSVKWLHANWKNPSSSKFFKWLMCAFTVPLLLITNLGIYGFLSKGHLEQNAPIAGQEIQIAQIEQQIQQRKDDNDRQQKRLDQISKVTDTVLAGNARAGLKASNQSKKEASEITKTIDENNQKINDLNTKLVPLKVANSEVEAKLGPLKYVAAALGIKDPEFAVRIVICLIMSGFDTLALCLFVAYSISLGDWMKARKPVEEKVAEVTEEPTVAEEPKQPTDEQLRYQLIAELDFSDPEAVAQQRHEIESEVENLRNHLEKRLAELDEQHEAIAHEREKFNEEMEEVGHLLSEVGDIQEKQRIIAQDHEALSNAHKELLEMEARLNDERELLKQWEDQLTQQQNAINSWTPAEEDTRSDKEKIIEMLEKNPQVVNEIVSVVDALRPPIKPGL